VDKHKECPKCQGELVKSELGIVIVPLTDEHQPVEERHCKSCGYIVIGSDINGKSVGHIDDICYPSRNRVSNH